MPPKSVAAVVEALQPLQHAAPFSLWAMPAMSRWTNRNRARSAALLVAATWPTGVLAGAWTLPEGTGQMIVTGLVSSADSVFDARSDIAGRPDFEKGTASLLLEYGLTDSLTLVGSGEFGSERDGDLPAARPAIFDAALGARLNLLEANGIVLSGQLSARLERAQAVGDEGFAGLDWTAPQIEPRLLAGYGFRLGGYPAFVDTQAGYRFAVGEGPDEIRLDVTFGIRPWEHVLLLAQGFSTVARGGDAGSPYAFHKAQGSLVYDLNDRWSLQAGAFATVAGHNALRERGLISAVWYRF